MKLWILSLFAAAVFAQDLPKDFALAGLAYDQKATPLVSYGHCGLITADFCSFTTADATSVRLFHQGKFSPTIQTAMRTGGAYRVKTFGKLQLFTLGDVGADQAQTPTSSAIGFSASGGGFGAYPLAKHWGIWGGGRVEKTLDGTHTVFEAGAVYRID